MELIVFDMVGTTVQDENKVGLTLQTALKDRMKSTFIGSFVICFLIYNWKMFAILLFADWPIHCKIEWIDEKHYNAHNLWIPIGIALFYILILPYLNIFFDIVLSTSTRIINRKERLLTENRHLAEEIDARQKRKIADAEAGTSEIITLNERINNLTEEITSLNERNKLDKERYKVNEQRSKEIEADFNAVMRQNELGYKEQKVQFEKEKDEIKASLLPDKYGQIFNALSIAERKVFKNWCNSSNSTEENTIVLSKSFIEKLKKIRVLHIDDDGELALTIDTGLQFYKYLIM